MCVCFCILFTLLLLYGPQIKYLCIHSEILPILLTGVSQLPNFTSYCVSPNQLNYVFTSVHIYGKLCMYSTAHCCVWRLWLMGCSGWYSSPLLSITTTIASNPCLLSISYKLLEHTSCLCCSCWWRWGIIWYAFGIENQGNTRWLLS